MSTRYVEKDIFQMKKQRSTKTLDIKRALYRHNYIDIWYVILRLFSYLHGLGQACFNMTLSTCTKPRSYRNGFLTLIGRAWVASTALTSTPPNTFGINWNKDCEPGLITRHRWATSVMLLRLNGSKSQQPGSKVSWKAFIQEWRLSQQQSKACGFGIRCLTTSYVWLYIYFLQMSTYIWSFMVY